MRSDDATCGWYRDGDEDCTEWASQCGQYFTLNDGTPESNGFRFCFHCGKPLETLPPESDEEGLDDDRT